MQLDEVFGISPGELASYVERAADQKFIQYCNSSKHIVVYGSSKQGKTSLRKKHLGSEHCISINCQSNWSLKHLYESVLRRAGYEPKISSEQKSSKGRKGGGSIKLKAMLPGVGQGSASVGAKAQTTETVSETFGTLEINPHDPNDIIRALQDINFRKWIVLDDFHYLPQETQREFAAALKAFFDESRIRFIIIAVWREPNRISALGDLALRCVSVDVDIWNSDELKKVIEKGEAALNINFPKRLKKDLVDSAMGSVYIVQEVCYRLCQEEGVLKTQQHKISVGRRRKVEPFIDDVINQFTGIYKSFFTSFSYGFQSTGLEMYKWLLLPVISANSDRLQKGIPLGEITSTIPKYHPRGASVKSANIVQALKFVAGLQAQQNIKPFILDYDESNRILYIVDRSFILWIERQDRSELLDELGLFESLEESPGLFDNQRLSTGSRKI